MLKDIEASRKRRNLQDISFVGVTKVYLRLAIHPPMAIKISAMDEATVGGMSYSRNCLHPHVITQAIAPPKAPPATTLPLLDEVSAISISPSHESEFVLEPLNQQRVSRHLSLVR